MKTSTLKSLIVTLMVILFSTQAFAQTLVNTRVELRGARYSDVMWVFAISSCTRGFDNGWDGSKMFGGAGTPEIFAWEASGYYQIDAVPDFNDTYIGFKSGEDSLYTLTFIHEYVNTKYTSLYLIDSVANKTVDIYATGTQYTFTTPKTTEFVKRFKIVTSLPTTPADPAVPADTVVAPVDPIVVPADTVVAPTDPVVDPVDNGKGKKDKKDKSKKIKVHNSGNTIVIENTVKAKGKLKIYNALNGKCIKNSDFNAAGTTRIKTELKSGSYVVNAVSSGENVTITIVVR